MQQTPQFLAELWKRRVVQFGAFYLATAWLLLQVVLAVKETLHLPDWVDQTTLLFLVIGFPLVVILAWARDTGNSFSVDPVQAPEYSGTAAQAAPPPMVRSAATETASEPGPSSEMERTSIAVLPFQNPLAKEADAYFADDITESIISSLSRWRWFFVIARDSSFTYRRGDTSPAAFGRKLGVRYVLDGNVRKIAGQVRITAQLIDTQTTAHIWAERFDRELVDVLSLEDDITQRVVDAIEPELARSEGVRAVRKNLKDLSAFDCYQRGMWHFNKVTRDGYAEALTQFRLALERDPDLSLGHTGLARTLYAGVAYGWAADPARDILEAKEAASTAIRLDRYDALGHFALSGALLYLAQHSDALDEAEKAIALNPNFGFGHFRLGQVLIYAGRAKEAVAPIERSLRHSPYDPQLGGMRGLLALAHFHAGDYEDAVRQARTAISQKNLRATPVLAASLMRLGRAEDAREAYRLYIEQSRNVPANLNTLAVPYADPADREDLRAALREAGGDAKAGAASN